MISNKQIKYFDAEEEFKKYGDSPAIIDGDFSISYHDLRKLIAQCSVQLEKNGITENEQVGCYLTNGWQYVVLILALINIKAYPVLLNIRNPYQSLQKLLSALNVNRIIVNEKVTEISSAKYSQIKLTHLFQTPGIITAIGKIEFSRIANIIFTSGSGGEPKAVVHSIKNHFFSAAGSRENISYQPPDRWLLVLPLFHVGGLSIVFRTIFSGAAMVFPGKPETLAESILNHNITHVSLVVAQLQLLIQAAADALGNLKAALVGGSLIDPELLRKAANKKIPVFYSYGSTEMSSQICTTNKNDIFKKHWSSGHLLKYRKLRIDQKSQILVKGQTLFEGYLNGENIVPPVVDSDGWFATGDLGKYDPDTGLEVTGRVDNMFISGGENIHPEETERLLMNQFSLKRVHVVPVENEKYGFVPVVFMETEDDKTINKTELQFKLQGKIAKYKIPVRVFNYPYGIERGIKISRSELKLYANHLIKKEAHSAASK